MHRALSAMGGLPRRAPAPTTIALLTPPAPPNQSGKKPTNQSSAGGHNKCSRCKSRPKSGSGSSLCIRCKLQRDYGSPRGGFAAPRKKLPAQQHLITGIHHSPTSMPQSPTNHQSATAQSPTIHPTIQTQSPTSHHQTLTNHVQSPTTSSAAAVNHQSQILHTQTAATSQECQVKSPMEECQENHEKFITLEIIGENPINIPLKALRSQQSLTESVWPQIRSQLENEDESFQPEDLNRTMEIEYSSQSSTDVALPAEIMEPMSTSGPSLSRPPTIVSLPEEIMPDTDVNSDQTEDGFLEEARRTVKQYGLYISMAFEALRESPSELKWVSVLSVYQKKSILLKILDRLGSLERLLLPPEEQSAVDRITRSVEELFNSMRHLQGQMTSNQSPNIQIAQSPPFYASKPIQEIPKPTPELARLLPDLTKPELPKLIHEVPKLVQETELLDEISQFDGSYAAKSLKEEADEEIKKILAKLENADRRQQSPQFDVPKEVGQLLDSRIYSTTQSFTELPPPPYGYTEMHDASKMVPTNNLRQRSSTLDSPSQKRQNLSISAPQLRNLLAKKVTPLQGPQSCYLQTQRLSNYVQPKQNLPSYQAVENQQMKVSYSPMYASSNQTGQIYEPTLNQLNSVYSDSQAHLSNIVSISDDPLETFTNQQWSPSTSMGVYNMR